MEGVLRHCTEMSVDRNHGVFNLDLSTRLPIDEAAASAGVTSPSARDASYFAVPDRNVGTEPSSRGVATPAGGAPGIPFMPHQVRHLRRQVTVRRLRRAW